MAPPPTVRRPAKLGYLHRLLLVAGSFILTLGLIELPALLNLINYEGLEFSGVWGGLRFIRVPDPELTHREPPHAHYKGSSRGGDIETAFNVPPADRALYQWDLRYDRNGFRNDSDLTSAQIVVIGDSMVEGMTVPDADLMTNALGRSLGKTVANLGQFGFGPQQELIVLKRYGLNLKPGVIVWMFSESNDLKDTIGYREIARHPPGFWNFFLQRSFTRVVYRAVKRLTAPKKPDAIARAGVMPGPDGQPLKVYFTYPQENLTAQDMDALEETKGVIRTADKLAAGQGARFVFVFIPDKFRVYRPYCTFPPESECRRWAVTDLPERMRQAVASVSPDIGFVDLTGALTEAAGKREMPYYTDDVHLSPAGHRIAAGVVGDYLSGKK